jgi:hypothetical protein
VEVFVEKKIWPLNHKAGKVKLMEALIEIRISINSLYKPGKKGEKRHAVVGAFSKAGIVLSSKQLSKLYR